MGQDCRYLEQQQYNELRVFVAAREFLAWPKTRLMAIYLPQKPVVRQKSEFPECEMVENPWDFTLENRPVASLRRPPISRQYEVLRLSYMSEGGHLGVAYWAVQNK